MGLTSRRLRMRGGRKDGRMGTWLVGGGYCGMLGLSHGVWWLCCGGCGCGTGILREREMIGMTGMSN